MRAVLVTGGAGYVGSHVVRELRRVERDAIVFDDLSSGNREAVLGAPLVVGDIQDRDALVRACTAHRVGAIVHLAAALSVPDSMRAPAFYYRTNVLGTTTVLDAAAAASVPHLVVASSAAVYGEGIGRPFREDDPLQPMNVYGETKVVVERALPYFAAIHGVTSVALRLFNVAGADPNGAIGELHEPETHLVAELVGAAVRGIRCDLHGDDYPTADGTCIRDFVHVSDVARAFVSSLRWLEAGGAPRIYNVGGGCGHSVFDVVRVVEAVIGSRVLTRMTERRPGDPVSLVACCDRIREELGWIPTYSDLTSIVSTMHDWERSAVRAGWVRAIGEPRSMAASPSRA